VGPRVEMRTIADHAQIAVGGTDLGERLAVVGTLEASAVARDVERAVGLVVFSAAAVLHADVADLLPGGPGVGGPPVTVALCREEPGLVVADLERGLVQHVHVGALVRARARHSGPAPGVS